jgi:hypothetical protein
MVNFSFDMLKTKSNAYSSHILCIWSVWASVSTCIYCCTHGTTPLRAFLHFDCYTPKAPILSAFSTFHLRSLHSLRGVVFFLFLPCLKLVEYTCQQGDKFWENLAFGSFGENSSRGSNSQILGNFSHIHLFVEDVYLSMRIWVMLQKEMFFVKGETLSPWELLLVMLSLCLFLEELKEKWAR